MELLVQIQKHVLYFAGRVSLIAGLEYGIMVEWKMEWNSEYAQLLLTGVIGTVQWVELPGASLGQLSYCRGFVSKSALPTSSTCFMSKLY